MKAKAVRASRKVRKSYKVRKPKSKLASSKGQGFIAVRRLTEKCYFRSGSSSNPTLTGYYTKYDSTPAGALLQLGTAVANGFGAYDLPFVMTFRIADLIDYTDITNLCDEYKFHSVKIKIYFNSNGVSVSSSNSLPFITYSPDSDVLTLGSLNEAGVRVRQNAKIRYFNQKNYMIIKLKPKMMDKTVLDTDPDATGAGTTGISTVNPQWIDTNYIQIPHLGLKGVFQNLNLPTWDGNAVTGFNFDVEYTILGRGFQ